MAANATPQFPNLVVIFWDNGAVATLFQHAPAGFQRYVHAYLLLKPSYGGTQDDMFRYLVLYLEGGI